ncbi:MAG: biotin-(acetyl-CoA carboxylase) ligase [Bacteroidetes bacterium]|nr:biotin-(acetyl-CoA carboxylase) ligase [Bacteroidota bacterium]
MFTKEELARGLDSRIIGTKFFVFDSVDSTNACAKTLADAGIEEGAVVLTDFQTAGRGRNGRSWNSETGQNLLFSVVLRPEFPKEQATFLTFYSAISIVRALEPELKVRIECKWPNDLLLNGKKFCGILLENSFQQDKLTYSVVGIGLNVNQKEFGEDLKERATSLRFERKKNFDRKRLFQKILSEMDRLYESVQAGDFRAVMEDWNKHCTMFGKTVKVVKPHETLSGTAVGLSPEGGLVVETSTGTSTVYAGDVSILT